uniref:GATA-type domain-containing protein n=1 Tax=Labrus bergylta TaxID=56723 RepID=A0A3Q3N143_9LABR
MSTGPRTQAAFIQGKQSALERDPSHSALLYLFQEVSKLGSPVHNSFLDTCSTSTGLNETSRLGHFIVRREEEDAQSFSISNSSCQHSLTCLSPFNQVKKVKEEGLSSSVTNLDEPRPECNSPWKVLSLINLQCERLLNPRDVGESALNSVSSVAKVECVDGPVEEKIPPVAQLNLNFKGHINPSHSVTSELESGPVQEKEIDHPSTQQWRTKTPRKQRHPSRSADIQDPDFQGVTFRMDTELDDSKEQCRSSLLQSTGIYSLHSVRKPRLRTRTAPKFFKTSSSDEENDPTTSSSSDKVCASCCTRKTPMWRDAEMGPHSVMYKKYRVRCVNCWHIPRKESNSNSCCPKCGNFVKLTSAQRKHSA